MSAQNQQLASHCYFSNIIVDVICREWSKEVPIWILVALGNLLNLNILPILPILLGDSFSLLSFHIIFL